MLLLLLCLVQNGQAVTRMEEAGLRASSVHCPMQPESETYRPLCHQGRCVMVASWRDKDHVSTSLTTFEAHIRREILSLFHRKDRNAVLLDVGANVGVHTFSAALRGIPVIAVEAMPSNSDMLRRSLCHPETAPEIVDRVALVETALGRQREKDACHIWSHPENVGNGQLECDGRKPCPECVLLAAVSIETLDGLLQTYNHSHAPILCAKIDIECFEPFLFQGRRTTLHEGRISHIVMEFNGPLLERRTGMSGLQFLELVHKLGFDVFLDGFFKNQLFPLQFPSFSTRTTDIFLSYRYSLKE